MDGSGSVNKQEQQQQQSTRCSHRYYMLSFVDLQSSRPDSGFGMAGISAAMMGFRPCGTWIWCVETKTVASVHKNLPYLCIITQVLFG